MAYERALRRWVAAASVCGVVLTGCTGESDEDTKPAAGKSSESGKSSKSSKATDSEESSTDDPKAPTLKSVQADPAKLPKGAEGARKLIGAVIADPELFGPEVKRGSPYERPSGDWAVLDEKCVWQRGEVPDDVLATRTRYYEVPAAGGKGPVHLTATVTVHRSAEDADWANAAMLEEALRCPDQQLRGGEKLTGLFSNSSHFGEGQNAYAEDALDESGEYVSKALGGPHPYWWSQVRSGSVLVSVAVRPGKGHGNEATRFLVKPLTQMMLGVQDRVGWSETEAGEPSASTEPSGKGADE